VESNKPLKLSACACTRAWTSIARIVRVVEVQTQRTQPKVDGSSTWIHGEGVKGFYSSPFKKLVMKAFCISATNV